MLKKLMFKNNTLTALAALTALYFFFLSSGSITMAQTASIGGTVSIAVCGNNEKQGEQICDNRDLDGKTCQDFGYKYGELRCGIACDGFNFSSCYNDISELKKDIVVNNDKCNRRNREQIFEFVYSQLLTGLIHLY